MAQIIGGFHRFFGSGYPQMAVEKQWFRPRRFSKPPRSWFIEILAHRAKEKKIKDSLP